MIEPTPLRCVTGILAVALLASGSMPQSSGDDASDPPSFLVILIDDVGLRDVGPSTAPNLFALKQDGLSFPICYSSPNCSPTRMALLTGRYPHRDYVGTVVSQAGDNDVPDACNPSLPLELVTLPEALKTGGYTTAAFGKWHLSSGLEPGYSVETLPRLPQAHGFDFFRAGSLYGFDDYYDWVPIEDGEYAPRESRYNTDVVFEAAENLWRETTGPRFWYVAPFACHAPFHAPPGHQGATDDRGLYRAMIRYLDEKIGEFLAGLEEDGLLDDTYVVVLGDNGTPAGVVPPHEDRTRAKGSVFERGVRVPFVLTSPLLPDGVRGREVPGLVETTDLYRTVTNLAGVDLSAVLPADYTLDSESLAGAVTDPEFVSPRRFARSRFYQRHGFCPEPRNRDRTIVREGRYKLLKQEADLLLFDLEEDPEEAEPLDPERFDAGQQAAFDRLQEEMMAFEALEPTREHCDVEVVEAAVVRPVPRSIPDIRAYFLGDMEEVRSVYGGTREEAVTRAALEIAGCRAEAEAALPSGCRWEGDWTQDIDRTFVRMILVVEGEGATVTLLSAQVTEEDDDPVADLLLALRAAARDYGVADLVRDLDEVFDDDEKRIKLVLATRRDEATSRLKVCDP